MTAALADRVWFNVSGTPGTGAVTPGAAVSGYQTPAGAGLPDGSTWSYTCVDGAAWETGRTVITSSGTSCTRVFLESSTGSILSLSSNASMSIQALKHDFNENQLIAHARLGGVH